MYKRLNQGNIYIVIKEIKSELKTFRTIEKLANCVILAIKSCDKNESNNNSCKVNMNYFMNFPGVHCCNTWKKLKYEKHENKSSLIVSNLSMQDYKL